MSVKRYDILQSIYGEQTYSIESEDGYYVTFNDFQKLLRQNDSLKEDNRILKILVDTEPRGKSSL